MINDAFVDYIKANRASNTKESYLQDIDEFDDWLLSSRAKSLEDCVPSDAISYVLHLNSTNLKRATIRRKIYSLKFYYNWLEMTNDNIVNPFRDCALPSSELREVKALSEEQVKALLEYIDGYSATEFRDKAILEFLYSTGARVSEMVDFRYQDINFKMNFITLRASSGDSRIVPLGSYLKEALINYTGDPYTRLALHPIEATDYIFVNNRGGRLSRQGVWHILKYYANKLGIDEITPMTLRDSFAIHMINHGADLKTLQELMGFNEISSCYVYLNSSNVHIREVYNNTHPRS